MSRRLSFHKHAVPIDIDIDTQVKSHVGTAELKTSGHETIGDEKKKKKHVRSEEENRCRDDDVCFGSGSGDVCFGSGSGSGNEGDDDAFVPLRSVGPVSFDSLDSHKVGTEANVHIESQIVD